MNKVSGYTIPELVVAMILSSILAVGVWAGYRFIAYQFLNFNQRSVLIQELLILDSLLKNDFENSKYVQFDEDKSLVLKMGNNQDVIYRIEKRFIQREKNSSVERFGLNLVHTNVNYLKVNHVFTAHVTNISFEILVNGHYINFFYNKQYDYCSFFNIINNKDLDLDR